MNAEFNHFERHLTDKYFVAPKKPFYFALGGIGLALLLATAAGVTVLAWTFAKITALEKRNAAAFAELNRCVAEIDRISSSAASAETLQRDLANLRSATQAAFDQIGPELATLRTSITKLEEAAQKAPPRPVREPVVARPGEYIVKAGDVSAAAIARNHGVSLADLQAVNPGVNWNKLKIGDKLKLPSRAPTPAEK